jgi:hypothetical protein
MKARECLHVVVVTVDQRLVDREVGRQMPDPGREESFVTRVAGGGTSLGQRHKKLGGRGPLHRVGVIAQRVCRQFQAHMLHRIDRNFRPKDLLADVQHVGVGKQTENRVT